MHLKQYILLLGLACTMQVHAQVPQQPSKKGKDIQLHNNGYVIWLSSEDVVEAILYVDSKTGEDHGPAIQRLKQGLVKLLDLQTATDDDPVAAALKKAAGTWLIYHGKSYIEKNGRPVKTIVADSAPEMTEMDGTTKRTVFFSEPGNSTAIFCGDISSEVDEK